VFGRVVEGLKVLDVLEACGSGSGKTRQPCKVTNSGEVKAEAKKEDTE